MEDQKKVTSEQPEGTAPDTKPTPSIEELTKQIETLTAAMNKQKQAIDNASADAAEWKRKYRSTMDEAARLEEERKEADALKDAKIAELERREAVKDNIASFIAMGYSEDLARQSAEALYDGDNKKLIELQKSFFNTYETNVKAKMLNSQPGLTPGKTPSGVQVEDPLLAAFRRGAKG